MLAWLVEIAGLSPNEVEFFNLPNPSCTRAMGSYQPLNRYQYQKSF
jgi:hypothetical protein